MRIQPNRHKKNCYYNFPYTQKNWWNPGLPKSMKCISYLEIVPSRLWRDNLMLLLFRFQNSMTIMGYRWVRQLYKSFKDYPRVQPWTGPFICSTADLQFLSGSEKDGHSQATTPTEDESRSRSLFNILLLLLLLILFPVLHFFLRKSIRGLSNRPPGASSGCG